MSLRKVIKTRGSFPNQEAAMKLLYLALEHIAKKWTMPVQNWKPPDSASRFCSATVCPRSGHKPAS
jgi:transposase-like protein